MGAKLREYRSRIRSVNATKKITRAMELISASRIAKAQQRAAAAAPYAEELTRAISLLATFSNLDHPLTREPENPQRAAVLLLTSDRGLAGAYNSSVLREGDRLTALLQEQGKEVVPFLSGRKAIAYYRFRKRETGGEWSGYTDQPTYEDAVIVADALIEAFNTPTDEGGVDEVHVVYTRFDSMLIQTPVAFRLAPLEIVEADEEDESTSATATEARDRGLPLPLYEFEPSPREVLSNVLPKYVRNRIYACMLQAAASKHAATQRAMKSATDNAEELIEKLTREANQARQGEITQEISEIVGGASALADASS